MVIMRRPAFVTAAISVCFVLLQICLSSFEFPSDSYRYAKAAEQFGGATPAEANSAALDAFCTSKADRLTAEQGLRPAATDLADFRQARLRECFYAYSGDGDLTSTDPRYQAIFSTRPGYPLMLVPFVRVFGVFDGMRIFGLLAAVSGGLMIVGLLRSAGLSPAASAVGQIGFLASPLGWWASQALGEGLFMVCTLGVIWGASLLMRRRWLSGPTLMIGGLVGAVVTRYSSAIILVGFLAIAAAGAWLLTRRFRHSGTVVVAAISGAGAALIAVGMRLLSLPSATITLQDTFTEHFVRPEVPDPWGSLLGLASRLWTHWLHEQAAAPAYLGLVAVATWALVRYGRELGWLSLPLWLTGVSLMTAHPLVQEADRLGVLMWMPVILGLPLLVKPARQRAGIADS